MGTKPHDRAPLSNATISGTNGFDEPSCGEGRRGQTREGKLFQPDGRHDCHVLTKS
jgi:hypothetical protein